MTYNLYTALYKDDSTEQLVAPDITTAAEQLSNISEQIIVQIKLDKENIKFSPNDESTITFTTANTLDGGNVYPENGNLPKGTEVIFTAVPKEGFIFEGFDYGNTIIQQNPITIKLDENILITAHYSAI